MPYIVSKTPGKREWKVKVHGKTLGTHSSKAAAQKQQAAIYKVEGLR